jgi:hypothetical protein
VIGGDGFDSYFGFTGANHQDMLVNIVTRAVRFGGYSVVLLQPDSTMPACIATDTAIKRGHMCVAHILSAPLTAPYDMLEPPENLAKTRAMVTAAIARASARYGGGSSSLNLGIPVASLQEPLRAGKTSIGVAGGLLIVPPSIVRGEIVRLEQ